MTAPDVRGAHLAQQAAITDDELVANLTDQTDDEDDCRATPAEHTARYRLESEWRDRQHEWRGDSVG